MAMGSIHWERGAWAAAEALLRGAEEHCGEAEAWRLNMGHVAYMQARAVGAGALGLTPWCSRFATRRLRGGLLSL